MATKTITVTEEAYTRLAKLKKENESFSETINRITGKAKLTELHGILSEKAAENLEKSILEGRRLHRELHEKRIKRISKEFS